MAVIVEDDVDGSAEELDSDDLEEEQQQPTFLFGMQSAQP